MLIHPKVQPYRCLQDIPTSMQCVSKLLLQSWSGRKHNHKVFQFFGAKQDQLHTKPKKTYQHNPPYNVHQLEERCTIAKQEANEQIQMTHPGLHICKQCYMWTLIHSRYNEGRKKEASKEQLQLIILKLSGVLNLTNISPPQDWFQFSDLRVPVSEQ